MSEGVSPEGPTTDTLMEEVRRRVRAELRERLIARGADAAFEDAAVFSDVDALFRRALASDDRRALLLPELLADETRPELSLRLSSHRGGAAATAVLFVKRRVMVPLTRWLYEFALENFRRQDRLNVALMACLQSTAAAHVTLERRVSALEAEAARSVATSDAPASPDR